MRNLLLKAVLLLSLANLALPSDDVEPPAIPPPASAYIQSIVVDPSVSDTLYLASMSAGLYRSTDAAKTWESIHPVPNLNRVYAVAIDPTAPNHVLTGGETSGLWTSADRGETWEQAGLQGISILDIAIDPAESKRVYVLAPEGVYRTDSFSERDWRLVFDYPLFQREHRQSDWPDNSWHLSRFQKITIDPHDPRTVMVGARWEGGFHRSDDGGNTWTHETISEIFRRADLVAFDPVNANVFYVATHHQGVFKSYNRGRSWVPMNRGLKPQRRTPYYGAYLIDGLAFEPGDSKTIYAGSDYSNWKTTDGGRSWSELDRTLTCEFARSFAVDPNEPTTVYAGTNVGVYKSTDGGQTWNSANRGLPTREILDTLKIKWEGEDLEFAVVRGRPAVFRRSLTCQSDWVSMSWLLYEDATTIDYDPDHREIIIQTTKGERRSADGGFRWDIQPVGFAARQVSVQEPPPFRDSGRDIRDRPVVIRGAVLPDDTVVLPLYQRPPYVSLQIVKASYPMDQSEPLWSACWDRSLSGLISIPEGIIDPGDNLRLYVEVRDFQMGTLTGSTPFQPGDGEVIEVRVSPDHLLVD
jgi:photosystem II stability/assembly factor-like uncharacterized protein